MLGWVYGNLRQLLGEIGEPVGQIDELGVVAELVAGAAEVQRLVAVRDLHGPLRLLHLDLNRREYRLEGIGDVDRRQKNARPKVERLVLSPLLGCQGHALDGIPLT